jgi:hypothetical protein
MEVRRNISWASAFEFPFVVTHKGKIVEKFTHEKQAFKYLERVNYDSITTSKSTGT